jgi:hypothetical protein
MADADLEAILREYQDQDFAGSLDVTPLLTPERAPAHAVPLAVIDDPLPPPAVDPSRVGASATAHDASRAAALPRASLAASSAEFDREINELLSEDPRHQALTATMERRREEATLAPILGGRSGAQRPSFAATVSVPAISAARPPLPPPSSESGARRPPDPALHALDDLQAPAKGHRSMTGEWQGGSVCAGFQASIFAPLYCTVTTSACVQTRSLASMQYWRSLVVEARRQVQVPA